MYYDAPICWRERRGGWSDEQSGHLFTYLSPEQRVPVVHPLRTIRAMSDDVLRRRSRRFDAIYAVHQGNALSDSQGHPARARTRRTNRRPIRTAGCSRKPNAMKRNSHLSEVLMEK